MVREDHRAPAVVSSVWYKVGGSYEHNGITGVSHMLEHMMFKGTKRFGPGVFIKMVNDHGGQQNAMTSDDYTMYFQKFSADQLDLSFRLESDRMTNLLLQPDLFSKERQVVMEERRLRVDDNPQALMWERFRAAAFLNSPYHHPTVGWMTDIEHLTQKDLNLWYRMWYVPNNAVVVVVGDVNHSDVFNLAKKYFGPLKSSPTPKLKPREAVSLVGTKQLVVHIPAKIPCLVMGYPVPVLKTAKNRWQAYALYVLVNILDSGSSGRLVRNLVRKTPVAVSAGSQYNLYSLHNNLLVLEGIPTAHHSIKELKYAFFKEIKKLQTTLVNQFELKRIKRQVITNSIYKRDSIMQQIFDIGVPEVIGLSWQDSDGFVSRIKSITPQQIQSVAKEFLQPDCATITILKPKIVLRDKTYHG